MKTPAPRPRSGSLGPSFNLDADWLSAASRIPSHRIHNADETGEQRSQAEIDRPFAEEDDALSEHGGRA